MIRYSRFLMAASFACLLPLQVYAEAPVVDDSENFALLDDQQVAYEQPVARARAVESSDYDEESALARDNVEVKSHSNGNNAMLLDKVQGLQQEIQELRGQLEVQSHDLKLLQQQQLSFYKDLDARLRSEPVKTAKRESAPADLSLGSKEPAQPATAQPQPVGAVINHTVRSNPADEQISYLAAYELVKNKKFDEAINAMQAFVAKYPQGGYTANAQYWLGELYMVKKNYPDAIGRFEIVLQQFPSSSKSAASMLKIGYALAASGRREDAIMRLQQVVKNYPDTNTAQLAKAKLESLSS